MSKVHFIKSNSFNSSQNVLSNFNPTSDSINRNSDTIVISSIEDNGKEDIEDIDRLETKGKITTDHETSSKNICDKSSENTKEDSTHLLKSNPKVASIKEGVKATIEHSSENNINMDDLTSNKVSNDDKMQMLYEIVNDKTKL